MTKTNRMLDFYYSKKQSEICKSDNILRIFRIDDKDYEYSECIDAGKKLTSTWDDVKFLGTASIHDCTINGVKQ